MVKKVILGFVIILLLVGLALWYFLNQAVSPGGDKNPVVASVKKALVKSVGLTCEYTDAQGAQAKTSVKNGAIRSDRIAKNASESGSVIVKEKKVYFWNTSTKQGFMMVMPEEGQTAQNAPPQALLQIENVVSGVQDYKDTCKPSMPGDDLFVPPTDVTFTDYSKMMPAPSGGQEMTEEQMQQYMDQYQKQQN